jgi:chemotaxis protein CheD
VPQTDADSFRHIRRMQDQRFPHEIAVILPGEFFVSATPMVVYTVLGSCISACIRDPVAQVGGMNHFMLPEPKGDGKDSWGESTRYGSYAMETLINEILKRGGRKQRLLFGAGKIHDSMIDVGARNAEWVLEFLRTEGLQAANSDLGDVFPRKVYYFTESGRILLKKIERVKNHTIMDREREYAATVQAKQQVVVEEEVTLF